ncbi:hypothetical protein N7G274_002445 [Stereocaulon virgatum]|uniref:Uncharacterized protein n=1 Tax=Stereocaulon virgatum TaxID=373712 RepID=A0ABR4AIM0_9LECA
MMRSYDPLEDIKSVAFSIILYWSIVEAGLSLIAACLPTLRLLVAKTSMDSIVRSFRSAISLGSVASSRNRCTANVRSDQYIELGGQELKAAHVAYMKRSDGEVESHIMHDQREHSREFIAGVIHMVIELAQGNHMV